MSKKNKTNAPKLPSINPKDNVPLDTSSDTPVFTVAEAPAVTKEDISLDVTNTSTDDANEEDNKAPLDNSLDNKDNKSADLDDSNKDITPTDNKDLDNNKEEVIVANPFLYRNSLLPIETAIENLSIIQPIISNRIELSNLGTAFVIQTKAYGEVLIMKDAIEDAIEAMKSKASLLPIASGLYYLIHSQEKDTKPEWLQVIEIMSLIEDEVNK